MLLRRARGSVRTARARETRESPKARDRRWRGTGIDRSLLVGGFVYWFSECLADIFGEPLPRTSPVTQQGCASTQRALDRANDTKREW